MRLSLVLAAALAAGCASVRPAPGWPPQQPPPPPEEFERAAAESSAEFAAAPVEEHAALWRKWEPRWRELHAREDARNGK